MACRVKSRGPTQAKFFDKIWNLLESQRDSKIPGLIPKIPKDFLFTILGNNYHGNVSIRRNAEFKGRFM